jgi:hypothetical protein
MIFLEEMILTGSTVSKANALRGLGDAYENGTYRKERNPEKALKFYEKAAELGNKWAQAEIAVIHHSGEFHELSAPKSPEKAMIMAQRAADQGNPRAQYMLGFFLSQDDIGMDTTTEAHRLYSLSAYQGNVHGIVELREFYYKQYKNLEGEASTSIQESRREYALLSLDWAGRFCNKIEDCIEPLSSLIPHIVRFVSYFQSAMKMLLHERPYFELDPLTGYSHLPLLASIDSVISKNSHGKKELFCSFLVEIWKHMCANCGKQGGGKECVLKTCARCKAFSYCSKECQVMHWKAGHKVDCKGRHWI